MPTYTYRCNNCANQFDIRQRMSDAPLTDCPNCNMNSSLRKVLNSVGIVFKGSGFYVTDNRGKKNGAVSKANGATSENEVKTESEPAAKDDSGSKVEEKAKTGSKKKKPKESAV